MEEEEGMKKLKNPVFLETTHFQLSDEQIDLLDLEGAEFSEAANTGVKNWSTRIRSIHAGTTRNFHTYLAEELEKSVEKWFKPYGKPLLRNHDIESEPMGRVREADYIRFSDHDGVLELVFNVPDEEAIQKIRDQRYATVSVGVRSSNVCCSICGTNWFDDEADELCDHTPGRKYVDETTGEEKICTMVIRDIDPVECSFVNLPADANDERYAGVVHVGESEDIEFYADGDEGVGSKRRQKKSGKMPDDTALAIKESWDEFLSQFEAEGEESHMKDKETKAQENDSVEETSVDETAAEETEEETQLTAETEEDVSEEATDGESTEEADETDETTDTNVEESENDLEALEEYLSDEDTETTETEQDEEDTDVSEGIEIVLESLRDRVQELEEENSDLLARIQAEEDAAAEWAKRARTIISRHVADLKFVLNKSEGKDLDSLEEDASESTLRELLTELKELRKEFKESDFSLISVFSQTGAINRESLASDTPPSTGKEAEQTKSEEDVPLTERDLEMGFTSLFSNRPPQKGRS